MGTKAIPICRFRLPCFCGHDRFKTVQKNRSWKCRLCGNWRGFQKPGEKYNFITRKDEAVKA